MMATKVFRKINGLNLISDERDIAVPAKYRREVLDWCDANEIEATLALTGTSTNLAEITWGVTLWRVRDEQQRLMFILRWT